MVRTGQGQHWGVTAVWLSGRPDAGILSRAWEEVHARHPMLGARLRRQWRGWRLAWETAGPVAAPPVVWSTLAEGGTEEDLIRERLQGRAAGQALTTPLWLEVFAVPGGDYLVLLSWRHALMDGTGVNLLLEKLAAGTCETGPPALPQPHATPPGTLYQKAAPLIRRLRELTCTGCFSAWRKGLPLQGQPDYHLVALTTEQSARAAARLRELCGEFFQMPFYAAVAARALRQLHRMRAWHSPALHLQLPTQVRGRSRDLLFGNHMGTLPLFLEDEHLATLPAAVAHLQEQYKEAVKSGLQQASEAMMSLAWYLPVPAFIPAVRQTNLGQICSLFHSHTGAFLPDRADFAGAAVRNVCTIPSVSTPPGLGLFFSDFKGRITGTLAWRGMALRTDEIQAVAACIQADLTGEA